MITFKQFILEYTDLTKKYSARHQNPNGLSSGFVNQPRKSFNLIAQYRKDKKQELPAIQRLKQSKGVHNCSMSDLNYIRQTYPQLNIEQLTDKGKALGKTGIMIKKVIVGQKPGYILFN